ncbi:MarR family winged helix-turn-helix transcriptional regulator [Pararcticibacter amylolyticus]|uniref:MarR family transcriptional regulator n=1 Tax=Pararcticibacter amylolyticus TaxID=2173175 RepID=A0A2U2PC48_9SPHI|nr:winged helix DNA-binding protein [Pararcticibacter amylolyticus]PWG78923.1 MarR family transcriptional regulator [Pararcticibacter amylolyticus]
MNYNLLKEVVDLIRDFEADNTATESFSNDIDGFRQWIQNGSFSNDTINEPHWEGKMSGRSPDSVINTLIVHMNRYAKSYSRAAIYGSGFSTQDDFIYLITLKAFGAMTKTELIKKNIHDKPAGIKVINRLVANNWAEQKDSERDKRSKVISITKKGLIALEKQMGKIRRATKIVTGNLDTKEKMQLISLLQKLEDFHKPIYEKNPDIAVLEEVAYAEYLKTKNFS